MTENSCFILDEWCSLIFFPFQRWRDQESFSRSKFSELFDRRAAGHSRAGWSRRMQIPHHSGNQRYRLTVIGLRFRPKFNFCIGRFLSKVLIEKLNLTLLSVVRLSKKDTKETGIFIRTCRVSSEKDYGTFYMMTLKFQLPRAWFAFNM